MIGIIAAMRGEIARIVEAIADPDEKHAGGLKMVCGKIGDKAVVVTACGIGKVKAAAATQAMIDAFAPEAILCIGTAGAIAENIGIGDIVAAEKTYQHDFDLTGGSKIVSLLVGGRNKTVGRVRRAADGAGGGVRRADGTCGKCHNGPGSYRRPRDNKAAVRKRRSPKRPALYAWRWRARRWARSARATAWRLRYCAASPTRPPSRVPMEFALHAKKVSPVVQALALQMLAAI